MGKLSDLRRYGGEQMTGYLKLLQMGKLPNELPHFWWDFCKRPSAQIDLKKPLLGIVAKTPVPSRQRSQAKSLGPLPLAWPLLHLFLSFSTPARPSEISTSILGSQSVAAGQKEAASQNATPRAACYTQPDRANRHYATAPCAARPHG